MTPRPKMTSYRQVRCTGKDRLTYLRRALRAGDCLAVAQGRQGRCWVLVRTGEEIDPGDVEVVRRHSFLGGRLVPADDGLPGIAQRDAQTWHWRANPPRLPRKSAAQPESPGARVPPPFP